MKNSGFTMVELLAVMVILGILTTMSIGGYSIYESRAKSEAYDTMASSAADAAEEYSMDYPGTTSVTLEDLKEGEYLSSISDPSSKGANCRGLVGIETKDSSSAGTLSTNSYNVHICCSNYNYTYKIPGKVKTKDKYCKADYYDITKIQNIEVLNVYPLEAYKNYFSNWMNSYGKNPSGKQVIHVTPVSIEDFNRNPNKYLKDSKKTYDVIVFGFADCNASKDLTDSSSKAVKEFLDTGSSAIFGHDTITKGCGNHKNFIKLEDYVGLTATSDLAWHGSNKVTIKRKGVFTEFPYKIGNLGTTLTIPTSHVYGQVAHGDVWLTFNGIGEEAKSIYLSTYGNNAFIQTGHSNGAATSDEQKILANIIFYSVSRQYSED